MTFSMVLARRPASSGSKGKGKYQAEKVYTREDYEISQFTMPSDETFIELAALLDNQTEHIIYIEVGKLAARFVVFGAIDRSES